MLVPVNPNNHRQSEQRRALEEKLLLRRYHETRDTETREQLIERFMPLARSLALRYRSGSESAEDLVQIANLGLIKAIDRYEPGRGASFVAYASPTILGELRHHFRDRSWSVRLPRSLQERSMKVAAAETRARRELQRSPTISEIAARSEFDEGEVIEAMQADQARRTTSLDRPRLQDEDESMPMVETIGTIEPGFERAESELASASADLRPKERQALHYRFHEGLTQREIGDKIGISQMQVSRLLRSALRKLLVAVGGGEGADPAATDRRPQRRQAGQQAA